MHKSKLGGKSMLKSCMTRTVNLELTIFLQNLREIRINKDGICSCTLRNLKRPFQSYNLVKHKE